MSLKEEGFCLVVRGPSESTFEHNIISHTQGVPSTVPWCRAEGRNFMQRNRRSDLMVRRKTTSELKLPKYGGRWKPEWDSQAFAGASSNHGYDRNCG